MQRDGGGDGAFREVPRTGVIYVTTEAMRLGFRPGAKDWCNLGQGQPETGPLEGAPERIAHIDVHQSQHEYAPVLGLLELREAVAELYNRLYRRDRVSRYGPENVAICAGGRLALTRAAVALGEINLGHFLPNYTAYEELLGLFRSFAPIPILRSPGGENFGESALRQEILGRGLGAVLLSNPCNPTGTLLRGKALGSWVKASRELDCALLVDEFYSHYVWDGRSESATVSAAEFVEDVNADPVIVFDGLTKNWRYPGWRVSWMVAPASVISTIGSARSFLDGGAPHPMQRAALPLLDFEHVRRDRRAIHRCFGRKRARMAEGLRDLGIRVADPEGTFYCWGDLSDLPRGLSDGMLFFRRALEAKAIDEGLRRLKGVIYG